MYPPLLLPLLLLLLLAHTGLTSSSPATNKADNPHRQSHLRHPHGVPRPASRAVLAYHMALDAGSAWEVVYSAEADSCAERNGVDSMPNALHWPAKNLTSFWAADGHGDYSLVGPSLGQLHKKCDSVFFNSTLDTTPQSFANWQWLQAVFMFGNGTGYALVHNEFHGDSKAERSLGYCNTTARDHCEVWSTGIARTTDGGMTFQLIAAPPHHRVFTMPYPFPKDEPIFGFGALSHIFRSDADGAFYGLVDILGRGVQPAGLCPFRTPDLGDPAAYRGWDGSAFSITFPDPYATPAPVPGDHVCRVLSNLTFSHASPRRLVGLAAGSPGFVLFGDKSSTGGLAQYLFSPSTTPDFAQTFGQWGPPATLDLELQRFFSVDGRVLYPTLLDERSPFFPDGHADINYNAAGNGSCYVYVDVDAVVLRRRVLFMPGPAPPAPPPPTPVPAPPGCVAFRVGGCGKADVNGVYSHNGRQSDGAPVFQLDAAHHLYRFQGLWTLGHFAVVEYYRQRTNATALPVSAVDWFRVGGNFSFAPNPSTVACASPLA